MTAGLGAAAGLGAEIDCQESKRSETGSEGILFWNLAEYLQFGLDEFLDFVNQRNKLGLNLVTR